MDELPEARIVFVNAESLAGILAMAGSLALVIKRVVAYLRLATADRIPVAYLPAVVMLVGVAVAVAVKAAGLAPEGMRWPLVVFVGLVAGALASDDYDQTRTLRTATAAKKKTRKRPARGGGRPGSSP